MINFTPIRDWHRIWKLCDSTTNVSRLFDDKTPYTRQMMKKRIRSIVENPHNWSFGIFCDNAEAGAFILYDLGEGVFETHILLKEGFRGKKGIEIGREGTEFALSLPGVNNLVSFCPKTIPESFIYALKVGWRSLGELPMVWRKNGVDYKVLGVCAN